MRGPILGIAFLLGPCFVVAMGTLSACQITPTETADAGTDVYIPPQSCDTVGYTCSQCQTCAPVQATCAMEIAACEGNQTCLDLAMCNDACDVNDFNDPQCKIDCCTTADADPGGVSIYVSVANCVYGVGCPQTCNYQHVTDTCAGFQ